MDNKAHWLSAALLLLVSIACEFRVQPTSYESSLSVVGGVEQYIGEVRPGATIDYHLVLRNDGDSTVAIDKIQPTCSCTVGRLTDRVVPPGGSVEVQLLIAPGNRLGPFQFAVFVLSDAKVDGPLATCHLSGEVRAAERFYVRPSTIHAVELGGADAVADVQVYVGLSRQDNGGPGPLSVQMDAVPWVEVAAVGEPRTDTDPSGVSRTEWPLTLRLAAAKPLGASGEIVNLQVEADGCRGSVSLKVVTERALSAVTRHVFVGRLTEGRRWEGQVELQLEEGVDVSDYGLTANESWLTVWWGLESGDEAILNLRCEGTSTHGLRQAEVMICEKASGRPVESITVAALHHGRGGN